MYMSLYSDILTCTHTHTHTHTQSLQEAFTAKESASSAGAQQDVSEFTHKLLEWIEDAVTLSIGKEQCVFVQ